MGSLTIETNKTEYLPGDTIFVRIRLNFEQPVKARALYVILYCHEKVKHIEYRAISPDEKRRMEELGLVVTSPVKPTEMFKERDVNVIEKKLALGREFQSQKFETSFKLPENVSPTSHVLGHDDKTSVWKLKAKIDIPLAPDINVEKEIIVGWA